jgi:hypothetical protein
MKLVVLPVVCAAALMSGPGPAHAGLLGLLIYGQRDRYGVAFSQCAAATRTIEQELSCARAYVAQDPVPAVGAAAMTAFFAKGQALAEAVRRGRMTQLEARAELAEAAAEGESTVQETVRRRLSRHHFMHCNSFGYSTVCNGY